MDEAVWYLGATIEQELEKAGRTGRKSKAEASSESARKRVLAKYFDEPEERQYMDPALLFQ